jgi:hypothetical protein
MFITIITVRVTVATANKEKGMSGLLMESHLVIHPKT